MRIAVLMSTYNGEKYLKEQINSILNQNIKFHIELWIRDDGSTDNTKKILEEYSKKGKLNWYTGENLGPARSFLDLVRHCKGYDFYAFADQDDYWMPNKLSNAIAFFYDEIIPQLYFCNAELVDMNLKSLNRNVYKKNPRTDFETLVCSGGLLGCTMVFNDILAKEIQKYPIPINVVMHDFYISVLCKAIGGKIIFDNKSNLKYRQHENNVIGVPNGLFNTIKNRIKDVNKKSKISIADQAEEICSLYYEYINENKLDWLKMVSRYKKNKFLRFRLSLSRKTKYINTNIGVKLRLQILLGNR